LPVSFCNQFDPAAKDKLLTAPHVKDAKKF